MPSPISIATTTKTAAAAAAVATKGFDAVPAVRKDHLGSWRGDEGDNTKEKEVGIEDRGRGHRPANGTAARQTEDKPQTSFHSALTILHLTSASLSTTPSNPSIRIPISNSIGRTSTRDVSSPINVPPFDNSAMDGYAVPSASLSNASRDTPVRMKVLGSIAAGDRPPIHEPPLSSDGPVCYKIMTGAPFPTTPTFNACLRIEDTSPCPLSPLTHILAHNPVRPSQHRRLAGEDFRVGDRVVSAGERVRSEHVMALACVGVGIVEVRGKVRVGVVCTGKELVDVDGVEEGEGAGVGGWSIPSSNGVYIQSTLESWFGPAIEVDYLGTVGDSPDSFARTLRGSIHPATTRTRTRGGFDVVISTGGISKGEHDYVPSVIRDEMKGRTLFHGVAMRPGGPVMFATLPIPSSGSETTRTTDREVAFFGLPGNPVASVATLRFLVLPYLESIVNPPPPPSPSQPSSSSSSSDPPTLNPSPLLSLSPRCQDSSFSARVSLMPSVTTLRKPPSIRAFYKAVIVRGRPTGRLSYRHRNTSASSEGDGTPRWNGNGNGNANGMTGYGRDGHRHDDDDDDPNANGTELRVRLLAGQGSHQVKDLVAADVWACVEEGRGEVRDGDWVRCFGLGPGPGLGVGMGMGGRWESLRDFVD